MFFTYLRRELRRRMRQAIFIALGLALGIGLVITVTATSSGVRNAQGSVLHALYGVGTDITVTQAPAAGSAQAQVVKWRAKILRGATSGTTINDNILANPGLGSLSSAAVTTIGKLRDVAGAAGGLALTDTKITGKIPKTTLGGGAGARGSGSIRGSLTPTTFTAAGVDIANGELGPLSTGKITSGRTLAASDSSSNVALVDSEYAAQNKLKTGSTIAIGNNTGTSTNFKVIGIVSEPQGGNPDDVYIPLARAQKLAGMSGKINTIYVSAASASDITAVSKEISAAMKSATVTTSGSLAREVTGSLSSASSLANNLGRWLAIAVLAAAFGLASLLTMAAVARRVREFGTLKALGWRSRRIVGQVMGESVAVGLIGGAVGVGLGFAGTALVSTLASPLSASLGPTTGSATPGGARQFGAAGGALAGFRRAAAATGRSVAVHLSAPVTVGTIALAVALAIAGGLIAGSFGGWRVARLRPAAALARVE